MNKINKKKIIYTLIFIILVFICSSLIYFSFKNQNKIVTEQALLRYKQIKKEEKVQKIKTLKKINDCLTNKDEFNEKYFNTNLINEINNFNDYLNNSSNYAIIYKEINANFQITRNEYNSFYGASIIKAALAIYIFEQAENDKTILENKIYYSSKYYMGGAGIIKNNIKQSYTVLELTKYMIEESDNIAFLMLYNNFNINDVRNFWKNFGTTKTFIGNDKFGNITANDALIYMEELNNYLNTKTELSKVLAKIFNNASKNSYIAKNLNEEIYFKYGETIPNYHEIALVNTKNPYIIVILTTKFPNNHVDFINNISNYIKNIHNLYYENKDTYCNNKYLK